MPDHFSTILDHLTNHRIEGIDAGDNIFYPAYSGYSLANLPASVCAWLGAPPLGAAPLDSVYTTTMKDRYRHVVVTVVDALGLDLFMQFLDQSPWQDWLPHALLAPLTSVTPSTTASALTTLWTGVPPSGHGIMGHEMWLKEYGMIAEMILQAPAAFIGDAGSLQRAGFSPFQFLPVPTLGNYLTAQGVDVFALQPASIARSGLSTMLLGGAEVLPYRNLSDLWVTLDALLARQQGKTTYVYAYWGDIDELSHRYGPGDERVLFEFDAFSRSAERFAAHRLRHGRGDTLWIMLADHGHIPTPANPHYELRNHPALLDDLVMAPSGENRLPYFFLRPGHTDHAREYIEQAWPGEFRILPSSAVLETDLFGNGEPYARTAERLGEWVLFPQGDAYLWWADKPNTLVARHGGLSRQEMLVPFWAMEL